MSSLAFTLIVFFRETLFVFSCYKYKNDDEKEYFIFIHMLLPKKYFLTILLLDGMICA